MTSHDPLKRTCFLSFSFLFFYYYITILGFLELQDEPLGEFVIAVPQSGSPCTRPNTPFPTVGQGIAFWAFSRMWAFRYDFYPPVLFFSRRDFCGRWCRSHWSVVISCGSYFTPNVAGLAKRDGHRSRPYRKQIFTRLETCAEVPPTLGMTGVKIRTIVG
jgi:hypothetical protein